MAVKDVTTTGYILTLFVRSDGARFLLGSGAYEFKDSQQHFAANTMTNDVVEVQGNDGYMLAGQVRRPGTQSFDGYVGDASTSKAKVEELRRDFFQFFRKGYKYKVVYIFPDGTAIQRRRGFLVDAPTVQELFQIYPEYHVAMNFEDVNYYVYDENADGAELYGKAAVVGLSMATGGLVWDDYGAVIQGLTWIDPVTVSGKEIKITNEMDVRVPLEYVALKGDTAQTNYDGTNLLNIPDGTFTNGSITWVRKNNTVVGNGTSGSQWSQTISSRIKFPSPLVVGETYTFTVGPPGFSVPYRTQLNMTVPGESDAYTVNIYSGQKAAFTAAKAAVDGRVGIYIPNIGTVLEDVEIPDIRLVKGSVALPFEPYVGGIPAPNPDYPQDIEVVTGEQTVKVIGKYKSQEYKINLGKNLLNINGTLTENNATGTVEGQSITVTSTDAAERAYVGIPVNHEANREITISFDATCLEYEVASVVATPQVRMVSDTTTTAPIGITKTVGETGHYSLTVTPTVSDMRLQLRVKTAEAIGVASFRFDNIQIEYGPAATDYAPYLEPIELCKIGDHQDYIYKGDDGWYMHKEVGKALLGAFTWVADATTTSGAYRMRTNGLGDLPVHPATTGVAFQGFCTHYSPVPANSSGTYGGNLGISMNAAGSSALHIYDPAYNTSSNVADFKTWLADNNVMLYYILATATDTLITDTTLVEQLEALGAAKLMVGENNILTAATTSGTLAAELEVGYYTGVDDGYGFVWDAGRAPSNIIAVDSIDNVYPVLTITGETINPVITNVAAGVMLQYNGTITASQTLVIDMMNQTATLNGTSVIGNISGDWLYFKPGNNRVTYTAGNANAPDAKIEWQEIVG